MIEEPPQVEVVMDEGVERGGGGADAEHTFTSAQEAEYRGGDYVGSAVRAGGGGRGGEESVENVWSDD